MPLEPPDPLRILDALRTALDDLRAYAASRPEDAEITAAAADVQSAIAKLAPRIERAT